MNLTSTLNKGTVRRNVYSVQYIGKFRSKMQPRLFMIFLILSRFWSHLDPFSIIYISFYFSFELIRLWSYRHIILRSITSQILYFESKFFVIKSSPSFSVFRYFLMNGLLLSLARKKNGSARFAHVIRRGINKKYICKVYIDKVVSCFVFFENFF